MIRKTTTFFSILIVLFGLSACAGLSSKIPSLSPSQVAVLKQEGFVRTDEGWEYIATERLLFGTNEAILLPSARETVEHITQVLLGVDIQIVRVDGHTDVTGVATYNDQLSRRRAQVVADVMLSAGMPASGITVRGMGSRLPVASNQSAEGRAQNRRVVLVILAN